MTLLVDTSVWSLALRRDTSQDGPEVTELIRALGGNDVVVTTGTILQELLQGFVPASARQQIIERFAQMPLIRPEREDHTAAADVRNRCRRHGVQLGTVDALLVQLAIRNDLTVLTTDRDFFHAAPHIGLRLWTPATGES